MFKIIYLAFVAFMIFISMPQQAQANEKVAGHSARMTSQLEVSGDDVIHELAIRNVLKRYNSPMADSAAHFIAVSKDMAIDPYLLPAIAGVESGFGRALIQGSYNPFGWGGGRIYFDDWNDGISTVGAGLRKSYFGKGAKTIYDVGPKYAGGSTTWAPKVAMFIKQFEAEESFIKRYELL